MCNVVKVIMDRQYTKELSESESVLNLETKRAILYNHYKTIIIRGKAGLYIKIFMITKSIMRQNV